MPCHHQNQYSGFLPVCCCLAAIKIKIYGKNLNGPDHSDHLKTDLKYKNTIHYDGIPPTGDIIYQILALATLF